MTEQFFIVAPLGILIAAGLLSKFLADHAPQKPVTPREHVDPRTETALPHLQGFSYDRERVQPPVVTSTGRT